MDRVPVELWLHVFSLACTDDGRTGRSLSMVSRQMNELSKPFKYQSIALDLPKHIPALVRVLERLPVEHRGVRNLYVHSFNFSEVDENGQYCYEDEEDRMCTTSASDGEMESDAAASHQVLEVEADMAALDQGDRGEGDDAMDTSGGSDTDSSDGESVDETDPGRKERQRIQRKIDKINYRNLYYLLYLISPTLTILSIDWTSYSAYLIDELLPTLPVLRELCLCRFATSLKNIPVSEDRVPTLLPSLIRLHHAGYFEEREGTSFAQFLTDLAPSLQEVKLPLYPLFPIRPGDNWRLPSTVTRVAIEEASSTKLGTIQEATKVLPRILFGDDSAKRTIAWANSRSSPYQAHLWKSDWFSRIDGGCGCWREFGC